MKNAIIGIISTLATSFIIWLSYTVYDMDKKVSLMQYQIQTLYPVLQDLSERS